MEDDRGHTLMHHFAQANPRGRDQDSVPALLRRVADTIDTIDQIEVMDLVLHNEITAEGDWYDIVVYYLLPGD